MIIQEDLIFVSISFAIKRDDWLTGESMKIAISCDLKKTFNAMMKPLNISMKKRRRKIREYPFMSKMVNMPEGRLSSFSIPRFSNFNTRRTDNGPKISIMIDFL